MVRKAYLLILFIFAGGVALLNIFTFFASMDKSQLYNFFYLSERASAVQMLSAHVVFESGLIMKKHTEAEIWQIAEEICANTNVDPKLVMSVIKADGRLGEYSIYFNGSVGAMRLSKQMLNSAMGLDPFIIRDNMQIGVAYLSKLIYEYTHIDAVLHNYFALPNNANVSARDERRMYALAQRAYEYYTTAR